MNRQILWSILLAFCLTGCATATRGTHERVQINSEPPGASAISNIPNTSDKSNLDGFYGCEPTPCGINFSRRVAPVIEIKKTGYESIKFKIVSALAVSSSSVPIGSIVAGTRNGSHVVVGSPDFLKRIPMSGATIFGGIMTFGGGIVTDVATGANLSLSPNPVTVFLAPSDNATQANITPETK